MAKKESNKKGWAIAEFVVPIIVDIIFNALKKRKGKKNNGC